MTGKYTNKNTKISDTELMAIYNQFELIDIQVKVMKDSKKNILKWVWISVANYYLRIQSLIERGLINK